MAEYFSTPSHKGGTCNDLFVGVACVPFKTAAAICNHKGDRLSGGFCRGGLDLDKPEAMLTLILNVIDNAIHVSPTPIDYRDIACIVINVTGDMDEWYARAFVSELKSIEVRIAGAKIFLVSDLQNEMYRISKDGPGFVISSGPPDKGLGRNAAGEYDLVHGPGLGEGLAWEAMDIVVKNTKKGDGLASLESRFLDHFHVDSKEDLEDILGFFDPIERSSIKNEILSIVAAEAVCGNGLALELCVETAQRYSQLSEPIVSSLRLEREVFPISPRGGVFAINPIFGRLYSIAMKNVAMNSYSADASYELGLSEARMAIDRFAE